MQTHHLRPYRWFVNFKRGAGGGGTQKAFIASCKTKLLKWEHCLEVRLKMCEEALNNQVKRAKKASWETDVNNGPGNERSKLAGRAPVCFYTHPGLAIKQSHFRGGWGLMRGSAYVPSWRSRATIPMLGKGVRYSSVYQEKGRAAQKRRHQRQT